jgi:methionine sulfoxide reductase catalytic subunit
MLIKTRHSWELPESALTSEGAYLNRRQLMAGAAGLIAAGAALPAQAQWFSGGKPDLTRKPDPTDDLYPARKSAAYTPDRLARPLTDEAVSAAYNNYYEFGTSKTIWREAQAKATRPWVIRVEGLVEKPFEIGVDDLIRRTQIEERYYRFRCVEGWAMAVPWTGFTMKQLLDIAKPTSAARYIRFDTFQNPRVAPGQRQAWYPWPYQEACTIAEAGNDLTLMVTGVYGRPLHNQFGAPLRILFPWKYGFKCGKAIDRIVFTAERPKTFWEALQPQEYGFWANVNPEVAHPRWSQATESILGTNERRPTLIYNGYGEEVAGLYKGLEKERLFV